MIEQMSNEEIAWMNAPAGPYPEKSKTAVTTPDKPDRQQFTPEQINEYCKSARLLCDFNKMPSLVVALQIIRQLQANQADFVLTREQGCDGD